jgi:hypothetical protein
MAAAAVFTMGSALIERRYSFPNRVFPQPAKKIDDFMIDEIIRRE